MLPQYSKDYKARINEVTTNSNPNDDWEVPYLNILIGEKVQGIQAGEAKAEQETYNRLLEEQKLLSGQEKQIYDRAFQKYNAGIPVSAQEAQVLGVKPGAFKPKEVKASAGDKGLSDAQQWTRIKDKLDLGIPLTPSELAILGGTPQPKDAKGVDIGSFRNSFDSIVYDNTTVDGGTNRKIVNYSVVRPKVAEEIIRNVQNGLMSNETAKGLAVEYGIDQKTMQQAENRLLNPPNPNNLKLKP